MIKCVFIKSHSIYSNQYVFCSVVLSSSAVLSHSNIYVYINLGLLAGNVFDWGAKEVALLMESKDGLKFEDALTFVNPRYDFT